MQNRCCAVGCFNNNNNNNNSKEQLTIAIAINNSSKAHAHYFATLIILRNIFSLRAFSVCMENSMRFEISLWSI